MQDAGRIYLPQMPGEEDLSYVVRLANSVLFPAFSDTVQKLSNRPFRKGMTLTLPTQLESFRINCDLQGTSLDSFAEKAVEDLGVYGQTRIIVDFPTVEGEGRTLADDLKDGIRPYFIRIPPRNILGWKESMIGDIKTVTSFRYFSTTLEEDANFNQQETTRVYEWTPEVVRTYKKEEDGGFVLQSEVKHSFGRIPMVTVYSKQTGFQTSVSPLEELAWLNLTHYRSSSDQRNILRVARVGILYVFGLTPAEDKKEITISPSNFFSSTNPNAKIGYAEHSGAAIGAGRQDLKDLKDEMEVLGLQPLVTKSGSTTAYERRQNADKSRCQLESWIRKLERGLIGALHMAEEWMGLSNKESKVNIYDDLTIDVEFNRDEILALTDLWEKGTITTKLLLTEIRRRGLVSEEVDIDVLLQELKNESRTVPPEA